MKIRPCTLAVLASCAFGGSSEDPTRPVVPWDAAILDAAVLDGEVSQTDVGVGPVVVEAGTSPRRDAAAAPSRRCEPASAVAICDPVHNTGCLPFSQCDVDTEANTPSGRCVLLGLSLEADCASGPLSTTCPAQTTCVEGTCKSLCYCDDDCTEGTCCRAAGALDASDVFAVCEPC